MWITLLYRQSSYEHNARKYSWQILLLILLLVLETGIYARTRTNISFIIFSQTSRSRTRPPILQLALLYTYAVTSVCNSITRVYHHMGMGGVYEVNVLVHYLSHKQNDKIICGLIYISKLVNLWHWVFYIQYTHRRQL